MNAKMTFAVDMMPREFYAADPTYLAFKALEREFGHLPSAAHPYDWTDERVMDAWLNFHIGKPTLWEFCHGEWS